MKPLVDQQDVTQLQRGVQTMRSARDELRGEIEMVSDSVENIHRGLVNMGGCSQFRALHADGRQSLFAMEMERANLVASTTMGMHRYMNVVRQQNRGVVLEGDTTDVRMTEGEESDVGDFWLVIFEVFSRCLVTKNCADIHKHA